MANGDGVIQVFTGRMVDLATIRASDIWLADIVVPLSRIKRFLGHTREAYSVAQHSVLVSLVVAELCDAAWCVKHKAGTAEVLMAERWGLLHDAHEAYLGDVPRPLRSLMGSGIDDLALGIDSAVRAWAGIAFGWEASEAIYAVVRQADGIALAIERRDLMAPCEWPGGCDEPLADVGISSGLDELDAREAFCLRWAELWGMAAINTPTERPASKVWTRAGLWKPSFDAKQ